MNIGSFRHKVQILGRTETTDSYGEKVDTYAPLKTAWAARGDVTRKDHSKDKIGIDTYMYTIRYVDGVTSDMRAKVRDVLYKIDSVEIKGRDQFMVLTISRVDNLS